MSRVISLILLEKGETVEGVINTNEDKLLPNLVYYKTSELEKLTNNYAVIYIISAYIPKQIDSTTNQKLFDINVKLTERVVQHFQNARIIYASSVSVYGNQDKELNEKSPSLAPNNYGLSKLWGEKIVQTAKSYSIARISSMYGVDMNISTFLPRMIQQAVSEKKLVVWGDGSRHQNYISVNDVAQYLVAAAESTENQIHLAVDTCSYSNLEVAQLVQKYCACPIQFFGNDNSSSYYYNNQQSIQQLNYKPIHKLEYNIQALIQWIKKMYS